MTVKELDEKYQASMLNYQQMIESQKEAARKAAEYNDLAETAAAAGDLDAYKKNRADAIDAESLAYVLDKQIKKAGENPVFNETEVAEAWRRYTAEYGKSLASKRKRFDKLKTELLDEYASMVQLQRDACATRERIGAYIGKGRSATAGYEECDNAFDKRFEMDMIPHEKGLAYIRGANTDDADLIYFLANMGITDAVALAQNNDAQTVVRVVRFHKA